MNTEKFINESFPQDKAQQFAGILKNVISSYIASRDSCSVDEWLHQYLSEQLPEKSAEEIATVTSSIMQTVALHDEMIASMHKALESGKSVEAWFQTETVDSQHSIGQQAYNLTESYAALTESANQYADADEQQEVIEVEAIPVEEWDDQNWNPYKVKDLVAETIQQAGDTALRVTASDLCEKVTEYGFQTVLTDKELIQDSVITGATTGLKVAVSGAMEIADARGVLPEFESDTESRSLIACTAIENIKTLGRVVKGEIGFVEGLKEIQDTSVATLATIVKTKAATIGSKIGSKIGTTVGAVFGPVGTAVGHFVGGAVGKMAGTAVGSKIVETAKKIGSAAKSVVSRAINTVRSVGNAIKSGLHSLFSW